MSITIEASVLDTINFAACHQNSKIIPSIINGVLIEKFDAPTNLIISISLLLANIVNLIVFQIKNIVTKINPAIIIIVIPHHMIRLLIPVVLSDMPLPVQLHITYQDAQ